MNYEGLLLGVATFVVIGIFHPIVIKTHYYFGTRPWWVFLLIGIGCAVAALFIASIFWSALFALDHQGALRTGRARQKGMVSRKSETEEETVTQQWQAVDVNLLEHLFESKQQP